MTGPRRDPPSERELEALDALYENRPIQGPTFEARVAARIELKALDAVEANLGSAAHS